MTVLNDDARLDMSDISEPEVTPTIIAFDTETNRISYQEPIPDIMCLQHAVAGESKGMILTPWEHDIASLVTGWLNDPQTHLIAHYAPFDLSVLAWKYPELLPLIFKALNEGRIHDTITREKLLNLTEHGNLDMIEKNGAMIHLKYSQKDLEIKYLNIDRTDLKDDDDSPRLNYGIYKDVPLDQWQENFISYAIDDPVNCGMIYWKQEEERARIFQETGYDPFVVEYYRTRYDWAVRLLECAGSCLDGKKVEEVTEFFTKEYMRPELRDPLLAAGLLLPEVPPTPYKNGAVDHVETCRHFNKKITKKQLKADPCDCPLKMKKGVPEKSPRKPLFQHIWNLARTQPEIFKAWPSDGCASTLKQEGIYDDVITEGAFSLATLKEFEVFPDKYKLKTNNEWMSTFAALDPLLNVLEDRNKVKKIVTDYLPRLYYTDYETGIKEPAKIIRGSYNSLVTTGRTSCYASKLYPSRNDQNVDPRVRPCTIPRPGNVIVSTDYDRMELCSLAQTCKNLFGESELANKINAGIDVHAYLAAQIAYHKDDSFRKICDDYSKTSKDDIYDVFTQTKNDKDSCEDILPEFCKVYRREHSELENDKPATFDNFFNHYRKLAKPVGLGYPGGLGAPTLVTLAKASYGLVFSLELAKELKEIWLETFPEMKQYFAWINKQTDLHHTPDVYEDDDGKTQKRIWYSYDSPRGMHRPKCTFCEIANGCGLQTFSAEGALEALYRVHEAVWLAEPGDLLYGVIPISFIHDEIVWESPNDELLGWRARAIEKIMIDAMEELTPDVKAGAESAAMYRWNKFAKSLWEGDVLKIWVPDEEKAVA